MKVLVAIEYFEIAIDDSDHTKCSEECDYFQKYEVFPDYYCEYFDSLIDADRISLKRMLFKNYLFMLT